MSISFTSGLQINTHDDPGIGTTLGASEQTHEIQSCAAVTPFFSAIAFIPLAILTFVFIYYIIIFNNNSDYEILKYSPLLGISANPFCSPRLELNYKLAG